MCIFARYREPPKEWVEPATGVVVQPMARVVVSANLIAVEDMFSSTYDRVAHDLPDQGERVDTGPRGKRGEITDFTRASQVRLMKRLACWNTSGRLLVVALTYPRNFPTPARAQEDFKRLRRMMRRDYPYLAGMWKLEYQTRGAVHFHLVLQGADDRSQPIQMGPIRRWLEDNWQKARLSNEKARIQCEYARTPEKAKFYLTKEVGKTCQTSGAWRAKIAQEETHARLEAEERGESVEGHSGRFWGWHQKERLVFEAREIVLPAEKLWAVRRRVQELAAADMVQGKRLERDGDQLRHVGGKEFDEAGLPSWQLFGDAPSVMRWIIEALREEGISLPDLDQWPVTTGPYDDPEPPGDE